VASTTQTPRRVVAAKNQEIHQAVREEYNTIVQSIVDALLRCDPRFLVHVYNHYHKIGEIPGNDFYEKFLKQCQDQVNQFKARTQTKNGRTQTKNGRRKENKRNKKKKS